MMKEWFRLLRRVALAAVPVVLTATPAFAVTVTPAVLYLDSHHREATVTLYNSGDVAEEVDLGFTYGYSVSDSLGESRLVLTDSVPADAPSALGWVRAFPRRVIVKPGESQLVRVLARPPAALGAGEYWARLVVSAVPQRAAAEQTDGARTMRLRIGTRIISGVHYRTGQVSTGVQVRPVSASLGDDHVRLLLDLLRTGNAAYIGRVRVQLRDASGAAVGAPYVESLTLYGTTRRRFLVPVPAAGARVARVDYAFDTSRDDLPEGTVLRAVPVTGSVVVSSSGSATHP